VASTGEQAMEDVSKTLLELAKAVAELTEIVIKQDGQIRQLESTATTYITDLRSRVGILETRTENSQIPRRYR